ncbi:MAG: hypothetical protein WB621_02985 [Candidatus Acidiferrales bacterium]
MTLLAISTIAASVACFLALAWLLLRPLAQESLATSVELPDKPPPEHAQHFPQLRHTLAGTDLPYIRHCASPRIEKHWRDDRQHVLNGFLLALGDDFARLAQLAALASAMLPKEFAQQRNVSLSLLLQFRANYRLAFLLLRMGSPAFAPRITRLAEPLGNLSTNTEASMAQLTHLPAEEPCAPLSNIRPD